MNLRTPADVALLVRERRRHLRVSQHDLAQRIGASRQWVQKLEQGRPGLELGLTIRALLVLGVTLNATDGPEQLAVASTTGARSGRSLLVAQLEPGQARHQPRGSAKRPMKLSSSATRRHGASGMAALPRQQKQSSAVPVGAEREPSGPLASPPSVGQGSASGQPPMVFIDIDSIVGANRSRPAVKTPRGPEPRSATRRST